MKRNLTLEQAQQIVADVVEGSTRWGLQYEPNIPMEQVWEAIILLNDTNVATNTDELADMKAALTKANRQVGIHKSREKKYQADIAKLKADYRELEALYDDVNGGV